MPRYINQPILDFETKDGDTIPIREIPEIPEYDTAKIIKNNAGDIELDELASRKDVFSDDAEYLAYTIFFHNIEKIFEAKFDIKKIKVLKIPVVEQV